MIPDYNYKIMCCIKRTEKKPRSVDETSRVEKERGRIRGKHEDCSRKDRDKQLKGDREAVQKLQ